MCTYGTMYVSMRRVTRSNEGTPLHHQGWPSVRVPTNGNDLKVSAPGSHSRSPCAPYPFRLSQGMHMGFGGNPYGPAGTGKTESVKALGQAFGRQVRDPRGFCSTSHSLPLVCCCRWLCRGGRTARPIVPLFSSCLPPDDRPSSHGGGLWSPPNILFHENSLHRSSSSTATKGLTSRAWEGSSSV